MSGGPLLRRPASPATGSPSPTTDTVSNTGAIDQAALENFRFMSSPACVVGLVPADEITRDGGPDRLGSVFITNLVRGETLRSHGFVWGVGTGWLSCP